MNKSRHPNLPSISTLLTNIPPLPPRIIVVVDDQQREQHTDNENRIQDQNHLNSNNNNSNSLLLSPRYLTKSSSNDYLSVTLSPILSPIDSYASSINSLSPKSTTPTSFQPPSPLPSPAMLSLPTHHNLLPAPLQGDDPPRTLKRHPSISSITSPKPIHLDSHGSSNSWTNNNYGSTNNTPNSPIPQCHHQHQQNHSTSPSSSSSSSYYSLSTRPSYSQHQQEHQQQQASSNDSSTMMSIDENSISSNRSPSPVPSSSSSSRNNHIEHPPLPPSTQIILSESGQPILKRRRGRPPNLREPALEGGWTFLTPTVWDVASSSASSQQPQETTTNNQQNNTTSTTTAMVTADAIMNGSMAAFTSSDMDMVLQMPRKKRGRKPKTHIVGNSCFVWKDITATRRSTKVIKEQQQQQQDNMVAVANTASVDNTSLRRLEPNTNK